MWTSFVSLLVLATGGSYCYVGVTNVTNVTTCKANSRFSKPLQLQAHDTYYLSKAGVTTTSGIQQDDLPIHQNEVPIENHPHRTPVSQLNENMPESREEIIENMISWVRSKGGYFSPKLEIRKMFPDKEVSPLGVFAKEPIDPQENLMHIPRNCYMDVLDEAEDMEEVEGKEADMANHRNLCKLSHKLMKEMSLGNDSEFSPYTNYLKTQAPGQLPVNWSKEGKSLLRKVARSGSEIVDWIDLNFIDAGCISKDSFEMHMVEMTIQRSFDTTFIPLWDMVNHDNGLRNTENDPMYSETGMKVRASQKIAAGEEILASYDLCIDCYDVADYWGTTEILKDFGFVENYPHRWIFLKEDFNVWFFIMPVNGTFEVGFDLDSKNEQPYGLPTELGIQFMKEELKRLEAVGRSHFIHRGAIPKHEWDMIFEYHHVATNDLSYGILASEAANAMK